MAPGDDLRLLHSYLRSKFSPHQSSLHKAKNVTLDNAAHPYNARSTDGPPHELWQDRDVLFSLQRGLTLRPGEYALDRLASVEDKQGGRGERGMLTATNLRLLWISHSSNRSISIGYSTIVSSSVRAAKSKLRGSTRALKLESLNSIGQRHGFVFVSIVSLSK